MVAPCSAETTGGISLLVDRYFLSPLFLLAKSEVVACCVVAVKSLTSGACVCVFDFLWMKPPDLLALRSIEDGFSLLHSKLLFGVLATFYTGQKANLI